MNDLKLIPIDPDNPPQYKTQMLFYSETQKVFRLGSVDYIREDEVGRRVIYRPFEEVRVRAPFNFYRGITANFKPTHYLNLELGELVKTINNDDKAR